MIEGKTASGFEYAVSEEVFDDYELLESISMLARGNEAYFVPVVNQLLGEKQSQALKEHLRARDGKVKTTAMTDEVIEIIKASKSSGKNS